VSELNTIMLVPISICSLEECLFWDPFVTKNLQLLEVPKIELTWKFCMQEMNAILQFIFAYMLNTSLMVQEIQISRKCPLPNFKGKFSETRNTIEIGMFVALKWAENSGCHGPSPRAPLMIFKKKKSAKQSDLNAINSLPSQCFLTKEKQQEATRVQAGTMSSHSFFLPKKSNESVSSNNFWATKMAAVVSKQGGFSYSSCEFYKFSMLFFFPRKT